VAVIQEIRVIKFCTFDLVTTLNLTAARPSKPDQFISGLIHTINRSSMNLSAHHANKPERTSRSTQHCI